MNLVDSTCLRVLEKIGLDEKVITVAKRAKVLGADTSTFTFEFPDDGEENDGEFIVRLTVRVERVGRAK